MIPTNVLGVKPARMAGQEYILKPGVSIDFDDSGGTSINTRVSV